MLMINEVTYYQVQCDSCGTNETGSDYSAWACDGTAIDDAVNHEWFNRWPDPYLLCPKCQKCEVCGAQGYEVDEHLVCEDHEDHEFSEVRQ